MEGGARTPLASASAAQERPAVGRGPGPWGAARAEEWDVGWSAGLSLSARHPRCGGASSLRENEADTIQTNAAGF